MKSYLAATFCFLGCLIAASQLRAQQTGISINGKVTAADDQYPMPSAKGTNSHQAIGYGDAGMPELQYDPDNTMGAGGLSSSAADLLKYHEALLAGKLLPKAQMTEMLKPRVEFIDYKAWYDYGWMTDKNAFNASGKHVITYHPGTDIGFFTMYARQEDNDSCIILLNNTGDFPRYDMTDLILDIIN